jgi:hypothetical protein
MLLLVLEVWISLKIVDIGSDIVTESVWEEVVDQSVIPQLFDTVFPSEEAKILKTLKDALLGKVMELLPVDTRLESGHDISVGFKSDVVNLGLFLGELSIDRECGSNIRNVSIELDTSIHQEHVSILNFGVIILVVENGSISTSGANFDVRTESSVVVES